MALDKRLTYTDRTERSTKPVTSSTDWPAALAVHRRWLRTVALARVGDVHAADEVLQEVAVAAAENGHRLRDPAKVAPWLYRVAVVGALQYRRRQGRRRRLADRYGELLQPMEADSREVDPLDWLLIGEQQALVRLALERLPKRDAEILLLKYTEDWTYCQLAEHMGLTTSAVEARLHRARRKLRRLLATLDPSLAVNT
jgi:RNA polymerase sigma-70 factor (ECF subfamily)